MRKYTQKGSSLDLQEEVEKKKKAGTVLHNIFLGIPPDRSITRTLAQGLLKAPVDKFI